MRINNVGPQVVIPPGVRDSVDQVRATAPVSPQTGSAYAGGRILVESMEPQPAAPVQERRHAPRRAEDRRKQQVAVTIDTRVNQRRNVRRRANDEPPTTIDIEA